VPDVSLRGSAELLTRVDRALSDGELRAEIVRLGPWHIDVEIRPGVSTAAFRDAPPGTYSEEEASSITFHNPHDGFLRRLYRAFPDGLEGRSVLDCACNCGAYLFYAKEAGAGRCLGFDVREHWIRQARFLAEHRDRPSDDTHFEVVDLYDLPALGPGRFDLTLFLGIFYHLPDPVTGLKIAADLTDEVLILNTATRAEHPDGLLVPEQESAARLMSGTYGLAWLPTGPRVLMRILNWLGFPEMRCSIWRHAPRQRPDLDRVEVIAARTPGFFTDFDAVTPPGMTRIGEMVSTRTRPRSKVLVAGHSDVGPVPDREITYVDVPIGRDVAASIEQLASQDAAYLVVTGNALDAIKADRGTASRLERRPPRVVDDPGCRIYSLSETV
jgi:tRNA (mo5U34)-methyltransferase